METKTALSRRDWLVIEGQHLVWRGPAWSTLPPADQEWARALLITYKTPGNILYLLLKGGLVPDKVIHGARITLEPAATTIRSDIFKRIKP